MRRTGNKTDIEIKFTNWITTLLKEQKYIPYDEAVLKGSEVLKCTTLITRRYLDKLTSIKGPLKGYYDKKNWKYCIKLK